MLFNSTYIGSVDFTNENTTSFLFWHAKEVVGYIFVGNQPKDLISELSWLSGKMRALPEWIQQGVVVGL
jgi:alpha-glucosidase (family GH31 glycosyl hydrolase)